GDPQPAVRYADQLLALATADGLYRDGRPALADGEPTFPAPLAARVRLRAGITSHDGAAITAEKVASGLERARKLLPSLLGPIRQAQAVAFDVVELVLLRAARADELVAVLGLPQLAVPRTGPFQLRNVGDRLRLEAFASYYGGRPYLDAIAIESFGSPAAEA